VLLVQHEDMGWLWLVGSIKLQVFFAKEPYKRDNILQKRPVILSILLTEATPYHRCQVKISPKVSSLPNILYQITTELTFEKSLTS